MEKIYIFRAFALATLILGPSFSLGAEKCPDLSGKYALQGDDGTAYHTIIQKGCVSADYTFAGIDTSHYSIILDGKYHLANEHWGAVDIRTNDKEEYSAKFQENKLHIQVRKKGTATVGLEEWFWLSPKKNLFIRMGGEEKLTEIERVK
jgi:hypothetical protein